MLGRHPRRAVGMLCWGPGVTQVSQEEETQDLDLHARRSQLWAGAASIQRAYLPGPSELPCQEHWAGQAALQGTRASHVF